MVRRRAFRARLGSEVNQERGLDQIGSTMIGHEKLGLGTSALVVLNDSICDTSTWNGARNYLDRVTFTWAFANLSGHGHGVNDAYTHENLEAARMMYESGG
jgi:hypothetical protein